MLRSEQVASLLGVTTSAVRKMVQRGLLRPERRGARPLTFCLDEVWRVERERAGQERIEFARDIWSQVDEELARVHGSCHDTA